MTRHSTRVLEQEIQQNKRELAMVFGLLLVLLVSGVLLLVGYVVYDNYYCENVNVTGTRHTVTRTVVPEFNPLDHPVPKPKSAKIQI
jgi:cell division septal protein FtsQ